MLNIFNGFWKHLFLVPFKLFHVPKCVPFSIVKLHFALIKSTKNSDAGYSPRYEVPLLKLLGVSWLFFLLLFLSKKMTFLC